MGESKATYVVYDVSKNQLSRAVLYPPQVIPYGMHMDYMEWVVESMEWVMESMD